MLQSPRPQILRGSSGNIRDRITRHSPSPPSPYGLSHNNNHNNNDNCNCQNNCNCNNNSNNSRLSTNTSKNNDNNNETTPLIFSSSTPSLTNEQADPISWHEKIPYYIPCLNWIPNYNSSILSQDFIAGVSLASFQIPLLMSYAKTILHVPPICGLLAVLIPPIVYSIFGSIPQLIVGPEPSISIVVGGVVEPMLLHNKQLHALELVLVITCLSGFCLLGAGLLRFGFLDTVLSSALLKGFIAAVGVVMICNSSIDELGLVLNPDDDIHSPYDKIKFIVTHLKEVHLETSLISLIILMVLVLMKFFKKKMMQHNYNKVIFLPEILLTVMVTTYLSYKFNWEDRGISVVGKIHSSKHVYWDFPLRSKFWDLYQPLMSSALTCAILGFFESTTLSKLLGSDTPISSNRELVALGFVNLISGSFGALPAFGGYGRSKINLMSGGVTCGSGAFMGLVTIVVILTSLKMLYYLPNCCLSCITTIVGVTILEEIPNDVRFFIMTHGWEELITFCITFVFAFGISMDSGIIMGTLYSVIRILKQSSKSRIQILKRVPGTSEFIEGNSDDENSLQLEDVENCLIVRIPEPLTFTNANDLKLKLRRLEMYGSTRYHPATPRFKPHLKFVIFDISEMTGLDSSSAQILLALIENYNERNIKVYLISKVLRLEIDEMLDRSGIKSYVQYLGDKSIEEVLKLIDQEQDWNDTASYRSVPNYI